MTLCVFLGGSAVAPVGRGCAVCGRRCYRSRRPFGRKSALLIPAGKHVAVACCLLVQVVLFARLFFVIWLEDAFGKRRQKKKKEEWLKEIRDKESKGN